MHPCIIHPFPAIAEAVLKSKSEFSGSATIVANPLFEPLWPFTSGRTGGCRPRAGGGEGAQLAFGHWRSRRCCGPPLIPRVGMGMGWSERNRRKGASDEAWFTSGSLTSPWREAHQKRHQRRLQLFNCYSLLKPSVCPKVLIINNRKHLKLFID